MGKPSRGTDWSMIGALGAAIGASACCTIPLMLVSLGIGGAWISRLTALEPYRPFFIAVTVGLLGYAAYRLYRVPSGPDCDCDGEMAPRVRQALLGVGVVSALGLIASPWLLAGPFQHTRSTPAVASTTLAADEVILDVDGMTCASCAATVRTALMRLDGVLDAEVTYTPARATVRYEPGRVSIEALKKATRNAGYPSTQVQTAQQ